MAGNVQKNGSTQRSEINITPLVDVVLVLLIIFMVLSPASTFHQPNAIPKKSETTIVQHVQSDQAILELKEDGTATLNQTPVTLASFSQTLSNLLQARVEKNLFIRVQDHVAYGDTVLWMSLARQAGATHVALQI